MQCSRVWQGRVFLGSIALVWGILLTACSRPGDSVPPFPLASATNEGLGQENPGAFSTHFPPEEISFTNFTVEDGLSQATVECIFQDSRGYLWFCTHEGVDRFDGYEFINLSHDPQDPNSIRANVVYAVGEDPNGNLWFGTQSGLDRFNPNNGEMLHVPLGAGEESTNENVAVTSILADRDGNMWMGTHEGIFRIDFEKNQIPEPTYYGVLDVEGRSVKGILAATVYQDSQGGIWAGTQHGLSRYAQTTDSFVRVPGTPATTASVITQPARQAEFAAELLAPFTASSVITQAIIEIEPGVLLLGGEGLTLFDARANAATPLTADALFAPSSILEIGNVWSIVKDRSGMLWIGTDTGLLRMDPSSNKSVVVPQIQDDTHSRNTILSMLQDREGNIWIGTLDQGIYVYQPLRQKFAKPDQYILDTLQQGNIWSLFEDSRGFLWIGTDLELLRVDRRLQEIHHYQFQLAQEEGQTRQRVRAIIEDPSGNVWAGTTAGHIYVYDRAQDSFTRKFAGSLLPGVPINCLLVDVDGDVWIGTNKGLYWYQTSREILRHFGSDALDPDTLGHDRILVIQDDKAGNLWLGTWNGLNTFDKAANRFSRISLPASDELPSGDRAVFSILPDHSGGLWLGSQSGGLHHFDFATGRLRHYQDAEGVTEGLIFSILEDGRGDLWLSTQKGLSMFDPHLEVFTNYSHADGLPSSEFNMGAYFQSTDGEMFFGSTDGFVSFRPEEVLQNPFLPPVVLTEITQSGERVASGIPLDRLDELTLSWPNNYFEFEFAALSYTKPENNQYAYYLEGIDPAWVFAGKNRSGRYVNLPGGTYTLHLIGSNNDGLWNTEGKGIQITIIPPIWQRLWVQIAVVFGIVGIAFAGYRYRISSILSRSNELKRLVDERTSELSGTNEQLTQEIAERGKAEQRLAQRIASEAILTERNRLARDLHDAVTQTIFSASILSETLPHSLEANPSKGRQQIEELQRLTQGALAELRSLLIELRPEGLVKTDLKDLLAQLCKGIAGRSGIPVELKCDIQVDIPSEIKITLYRIAQEALNNASRHADPSHIEVQCCSDQEMIRLSVRDDGKGFDFDEAFERRMGLGIMTERAADIGASLEVISHPGSGTAITVEWLFPQVGDSDA